ncbi:hypothetical protein ACWGQT_36015, partial [Streptomyces yangpuensis]
RPRSVRRDAPVVVSGWMGGVLFIVITAPERAGSLWCCTALYAGRANGAAELRDRVGGPVAEWACPGTV